MQRADGSCKEKNLALENSWWYSLEREKYLIKSGKKQSEY